MAPAEETVLELRGAQQGDGLALRMVWCFGWPVGVLYNIGMFLSGARFPSPSGGASGGGTGAGAGEIPNVSGQSVVKGAVTFLTFFGWMILWPTWLLTKFFVVPMTAANSRTIEYEADAGADAAELGGGLARALAQLSAFEIPRNAWDAALTSTHPPVELRIEAVEAHSYKAPDAVEDVTPLPAKRAKTMFGILVVLAALAVSPHVPGWHGHSNWWW